MKELLLGSRFRLGRNKVSNLLRWLGGASPTLLIVSMAFGQVLPDPPGSHFPVSATEVASLPSYGPGDRLVATYYFYWYKWADACAGKVCDPAYIRNHIEFAPGYQGSSKPMDALTDHPTGLEGWNYEDPQWHLSQINAISGAGIDIILPVFWGVPGRYGEDGCIEAAWSKVGLESLVKALEANKDGKVPNPRVGMFYDTSTLTFASPFNPKQGNKIDLRTEQGQKHFYATIRDFYSLVPAKYWALWEQRPLIWLYASEFASGYDDKVLQFAREQFARDFGGLNPLFVAHTDWSPAAGADWIYQWGAATKPTFLSVNSIGPGFDNSAVHGKPRGSHVLRERKGGDFYRDAWERALRSPCPITVIETWNELHEGTQICDTTEYGSQYREITAEYAAKFKNPGGNSPLPGPFQGVESVSWEGGGMSLGIEPVLAEDGQFSKLTTGDGVVLQMASNYLYFAVDDSFTFCGREPFTAEVEFFSVPIGGNPTTGETASIHLEYDSWDQSAQFFGMYKATEAIPVERKIGWKSVRFDLKDARLANNQNQMSDFRVFAPKGFRIKKVTLSR